MADRRNEGNMPAEQGNREEEVRGIGTEDTEDTEFTEDTEDEDTEDEEDEEEGSI